MIVRSTGLINRVVAHPRATIEIGRMSAKAVSRTTALPSAEPSIF